MEMDILEEKRQRNHVSGNLENLTNVIDSLSLILDDSHQSVDDENRALANEILQKSLKKLKTQVGKVK
jgi:ElaB/YqjD/DUF883 family membrane-anchored ribosome-binding protein